MQLPEDGDRPLSINLVPMLDVIFSILAFVIVSTLFLIPSEGLNISLPEALRTVSQTEDKLAIGINAAGEIQFQGQAVPLENLVRTIETVRSDTQNQLLIQADTDVNHGRVVQVMDELRQIPDLKLAIATTSPFPPEK